MLTLSEPDVHVFPRVFNCSDHRYRSPITDFQFTDSTSHHRSPIPGASQEGPRKSRRVSRGVSVGPKDLWWAPQKSQSPLRVPAAAGRSPLNKEGAAWCSQGIKSKKSLARWQCGTSRAPKTKRQRTALAQPRTNTCQTVETTAKRSPRSQRAISQKF